MTVVEVKSKDKGVDLCLVWRSLFLVNSQQNICIFPNPRVQILSRINRCGLPALQNSSLLINFWA